MKPSLPFLLAVVLLAGCLASAPAATRSAGTAATCGEPGTVQVLTVERVGQIGVYFPPCYDPAASHRYPVLYLLPGFGGDYNEWLSVGLAAQTNGWIANGTVPPLIVVTTDDTYEDLDPAMIIQVLVPYIDRHFRSQADRRHRAIAGGSLGGASAYVLTFQHPDIFSSAGVFGNGLATGQEAELEGWLKSIPARLKPRVFLNSGEADPYMLQQAKAMIPYLDKYGIEHMEVFGSGGHSTSYWISNFETYYRWLAKGWE